MPFDETPDKPQAFGYKINWFAVRTPDPQSVVDALKLEQATPANWASGLAAVYESRGDTPQWVFVSPPIGDWILAVAPLIDLPSQIDESADDPIVAGLGREFRRHFSGLTTRFSEVQFFCSYRVVGYVAWARARQGEPPRAFAFMDDVLVNTGDQSPEEARLGFPNLSGLSPADASDRIFELAQARDDEEDRLVAAGLSRNDASARVRQSGRHPLPVEEDVVELAALWSIDPTRLEKEEHRPGVGIAGLLPKAPV